MNKSDKYYLKQGKLELSMLEEDDEDLMSINTRSQLESKKALLDVEFPHSKRLKQTLTKEPKLKVTQDIYNTLHTMGQLLVKADEPETPAVNKSTITKKVITSAKAQKLEQIASSLKIKNVEFPPKDEEVSNTLGQGKNNSWQEQTILIPFSVEEENQQDERTSSELLMQNVPEKFEEERGQFDTQIIQLVPEEEDTTEKNIVAMEQSKNYAVNVMNQEEKFMTSILSIDSLMDSEQQKDAKLQDSDLSHSEKNVYPEANTEQISSLTHQEKSIDQEASIERISDLTHHEKSKYLEENIQQIANMSQEKNTYKAQDILKEINFSNTQLDSDNELAQIKIDEIVNDYFKDVSSNYMYAKELKRHINKQIEAIRNYE